ncbi:porin family protein [Hymenobacter coalescens]
MKKMFLMLVLCLGLGTSGAFAQSFRVGLKAGPTFSTFTGKDKGDARYLVGLTAGGFLNLGLTDMLSFQPELLYSMKGNRYDYTSTKGDIRLHYIDVPLLLRIDADGPFFELGPQVGYLLKATQSPDGGSSFERGDYNEFDAGYVVGIGYQAESGPSVGLRYNGALTQLPKGPENKVYNSAIMLQVGYRFE